jgi:hypothetical protein
MDIDLDISRLHQRNRRESSRRCAAGTREILQDLVRGRHYNLVSTEGVKEARTYRSGQCYPAQHVPPSQCHPR